MLDLDLDLEADLGVDTVKQAETFAAVREAFGIPQQENLRLRDYPTLASVIGFVRTMRPDLAAAPVAAPASVTAVAAPAPVPATPAGDPVAGQVLNIVADKTGYPSDMLDLDLDLEADLGVDTVKQAETFAAVREAFGIPQQENLQLRDYPTLGSVIGFVRTMRPDLAAAPAPVPAAAIAAPVPATSAADPVASQVLNIVADKTGYPSDMLDLDLDLEADLGVDTVKQAETFAAVREAFGIPQQENLQLRDYPTLGSVIGFVRTMRPDLAAAPIPAPPPAATHHAAPAAVAGSAPSFPTATAPAPAPAPAAAPNGDPVASQVLNIVADKTGYPSDMLDLDLDLEADLGVDTVKQAETFAAVRAAFGIPQQENLQLRDYPTLGHVIGFVRTMRPDLGAPTAAPVAATPAAAPAIAPDGDPVASQVLVIVADKTGYPSDMLDLDLDLEADLGVDTVKQAETFAAVRAAFSIPQQENLQLRDYPTLGHVIGFVHTMRPDLAGGAATPAAPAAAPATPAAAPATPAVASSLEAADAIPRRVPVPALRPAIDLCKPTAVNLGTGSRVVVMMDKGGVGKSLVSRLEKRGVQVLGINEALPAEELEAQIKGWLAEGLIEGVYWLPALDSEPAIEEMDLATFRELNRVRVKLLYTTMRTLYEAVSTPHNFLVVATRNGGLHGYGPEGAGSPLGGSVSGFAKAYKREHLDVLVKAVDFEGGRKTAEPADLLIAETIADPGIVEVGYHDGLRYTVTLEEQPAADGRPGMELNKETVFVVTGAAGGITSAIVGDLAQASGGIFYLLDLAEMPAPGDQKVALFRSDKEALKRALFEELKAAGEKATPVVIDRQVMAIERKDAALRAVEAVEQAGGTAFYHSLNLLDGAAVTAVVNDIRERYGRIDVLLHAGGLEISRTLPDKEPREFDLVFDVKSDGFFSLLRAAQGMPIAATVSFSSVAGRFGNSGQADYSAANDLLCKITSSLRNWRPETRGIVIDWTAWGGIGMATRGSIPRIMEMAGIDMLPPEAGIPTIRRELTYGGTRGELVVGQRLGILVQEFDETGGLDVEKACAKAKESGLPMIGKITAAKLYGGLEVETTFDPNEQPFLYDHQFEGLPLLPGVMGTEAFAELAVLLVGSGDSGSFKVARLSEQFQSPFKFYRHQPRTLYLSARIEPLAGGDLLAHTRLRSITQPPRPELPPNVATHFVGEVQLTRGELTAPKIEFHPPENASLSITRERIYKIYFHGPAYQVIDCAGVEGNTVIARMTADLPPNIAIEGAQELVAPRLIELCFQTAGIWEMQVKRTMALPQGIESATIYRRPAESTGTLFALVTAVDDGVSFDAQVVDAEGLVYADIKGYRTVQLPGDVNL